MPHQHTNHFTLSEAQAILPTVIPRLEELRDLKRKLDDVGYDIRGHHFFTAMGMNGKTHPEEADKLIEVYRSIASEGVLIKDLDRGLIDFPALRANGEEVYLCYMLGEPDIAYWHPIDEGFLGRQPVDTL